MRNISKSKEPDSLLKHRKTKYATYDNYVSKEDLRNYLVNEQKGICCYCMQRIRADETEMKIEHWQCQDNYKDKQLEYKNLLGACLGGKGKKENLQHCDTFKGNKDLKYNPSDISHDVAGRVKYLGSGILVSDDNEFNEQLNNVLNLNTDILVENRKKLLDSFREGLIQKGPNDGELKKKLVEWNGNNGGNLEPFCQVVVYYLKKKLSKVK